MEVEYLDFSFANYVLKGFDYIEENMFLWLLLFFWFLIVWHCVDLETIEDYFEGGQLGNAVGGVPKVLSEFGLHMLLEFREIAISTYFE